MATLVVLVVLALSIVVPVAGALKALKPEAHEPRLVELPHHARAPQPPPAPTPPAPPAAPEVPAVAAPSPPVPAPAAANGAPSAAPLPVSAIATPAPAPAPAAPAPKTRSAQVPASAPVLVAAPRGAPEAVGDRADDIMRIATPGAAALASAALVPTPANGASGWGAFGWTVSLLGGGAIGAVIMLRKPRAVYAKPAETGGAAVVAMRPVAPAAQRGADASADASSAEDLDGILRNGQAASARGSLSEAISWFDAALRIAPALAVAHFCRGVCLAASGRAAEAYGALEAAVRHAPDDANYRVHFARVALSLGRSKEAMDALELVARAMPELGAAMIEDPALAGLRDHPRFLMMCGAL